MGKVGFLKANYSRTGIKIISWNHGPCRFFVSQSLALMDLL
jgi:hypothetical protein